MHGHRHVARLRFERLVDRSRVAFRQAVHVVAALARASALLLGAEIGPDNVIELKVAAACIVKRADRFLIRARQVVEEPVDVGVDRLDGGVALPEVQNARARNRHLRRDVRDALQEPEMSQHRMI
jgi:hypothetical protein